MLEMLLLLLTTGESNVYTIGYIGTYKVVNRITTFKYCFFFINSNLGRILLIGFQVNFSN